MEVKMSDKAAKDFNQGMSSMESAAKIGAFTSFYGMLMKLIESSPAAEILGGFMERFIGMFSSAVDWKGLNGIFLTLAPAIDAVAKLLGTALSGAIDVLGEASEDSEEDVSDLADAINTVSAAVSTLIGWIKIFLGWLDQLSDGIDYLCGLAEGAKKAWDDWGDSISQWGHENWGLNESIKALMLTIPQLNADLKELDITISNIEVPTRNGDGGGDGGIVPDIPWPW